MEKQPKVRPFPIDDYPPTRPKIGTAVTGLAVAVGLVVLYYWPMISSYLGIR